MLPSVLQLTMVPSSHYLRLPALASVCYPSFTSQRPLIVLVYNWSSIHEFIFTLAIPVAMLRVMNLGIKFLWLADNEWVWEGHKLPCKCNGFPKVIFVTSQGFFHFLAAFRTQYFPIHLIGEKVACSITLATTINYFIFIKLLWI